MCAGVKCHVCGHVGTYDTERDGEDTRLPPPADQGRARRAAEEREQEELDRALAASRNEHSPAPRPTSPASPPRTGGRSASGPPPLKRPCATYSGTSGAGRLALGSGGGHWGGNGGGNQGGFGGYGGAAYDGHHPRGGDLQLVRDNDGQVLSLRLSEATS